MSNPTLQPRLSNSTHCNTTSHPPYSSNSPQPHPICSVEPPPQLYYFKNFPHNWTSSTFRKFFSKYLQVDSIYVSPRLNKAGKMFGFLKTSPSPQTNQAINWILSLWIGPKKFHINPAKYSSPNKIRPLSTVPQTNTQHHFTTHTQRVPFKLRDNRSFAEVTKSILGPHPALPHKPIPHSNLPPKPNALLQHFSALLNKAPHQIKPTHQPKPFSPSMFFSADTENMNWLKRCAVGILPSKNHLHQLREILAKDHIQATPMNGNMVLLTFTSIEDMSIFLSKPAEQLSNLLESVSPWDPKLGNSNKLVWIKCLGTPLHVWCPRFFQAVSSSFGTFLHLDQPTASKENLEAARFLIRTPCCHFINQTITVSIDNELYNLLLIEDLAMDFLHTWEPSEDCDSSSSSASSSRCEPSSLLEKEPTPSLPLLVSNHTAIWAENSDHKCQIMDDAVASESGSSLATIQATPHSDVNEAASYSQMSPEFAPTVPLSGAVNPHSKTLDPAGSSSGQAIDPSNVKETMIWPPPSPDFIHQAGHPGADNPHFKIMDDDTADVIIAEVERVHLGGLRLVNQELEEGKINAQICHGASRDYPFLASNGNSLSPTSMPSDTDDCESHYKNIAFQNGFTSTSLFLLKGLSFQRAPNNLHFQHTYSKAHILQDLWP